VIAAKTVAQEGGIFAAPYQRNCLCGGKSINELDLVTPVIEDKNHD
jgi:hypothetical protein